MTAITTNTTVRSPRVSRLLAAIAARLRDAVNREPRLPMTPVSTWPSTDAATRLHLVSAGARLR